MSIENEIKRIVDKLFYKMKLPVLKIVVWTEVPHLTQFRENMCVPISISKIGLVRICVECCTIYWMFVLVLLPIGSFVLLQDSSQLKCRK